MRKLWIPLVAILVVGWSCVPYDPAVTGSEQCPYGIWVNMSENEYDWWCYTSDDAKVGYPVVEPSSTEPPTYPTR